MHTVAIVAVAAIATVLFLCWPVLAGAASAASGVALLVLELWRRK